MDTKLYTLTRVKHDTAKRTVIYGHVTENVINDFLLAYVDAEHDMVVSLYVAPYLEWPDVL